MPPGPPATGSPVPVPASSLHGIHKIRHVIVIVQENRSFDSYFGTYPGADGIPMKHGVPTTCSTNPVTQQCQRPYYDTSITSSGGPHNVPNSKADINGGQMNGFVEQAVNGIGRVQQGRARSVLHDQGQAPRRDRLHGYHQIPNYWSYARHYVLQDHFFATTQLDEPTHRGDGVGWSPSARRPPTR